MKESIISEFGGGSPEDYIWEVEQLRMYEIAGFVYTELYDVEQETAGLFSYERVAKFDNDVKEGIKLVNAQDTIIFDVNPNSVTFWGGKNESVPVAISHISSLKLSECKLTWSISPVDSSLVIKEGSFVLKEVPYGVSKFFNIKFKLPHGSHVLRAQLEWKGSVVAHNKMLLCFLF